MISMHAIQAMVTDIKGKSPIDAIHLAQLHFPNAKLAWADESDRVKQIMIVDEYIITFEKGGISVEIAPTVNETATPEISVAKTEQTEVKVEKTKQPFIG